MKTRPHPLLLAALALLATAAQAQTTNRSVTPVRQPSAPATMTPIAPGPGVPKAAGLPSPSPYPAGLPPLPNVTAPSTPTTAAAPASTVPFTPPLDGTVLMPGSAIGSTGAVVNPANPAAVMGAGGGPTASQTVPSGAGPYTALQLAESFQRADANRDGELTRAEFQRLSIAPNSFEEMDRDRNGIVTRSEYDDGSR